MKAAMSMFLLFAMAALMADDAAEKTINIDSRAIGERVKIIGLLGFPLGEVISFSGLIVAGNHELKAEQSSYLIKVSVVDGKRLAIPQVMKFKVSSSANAPLPVDAFELYERKYGKKAESLSSDMIAQIEKGYLGSFVSGIAYETGEFSGIPRNLPKDFPVWQDHSFHFSTCLVVMRISPK